MTAEIIPFNPLDKKNLGASVAEAMLASKVHPLGAVPEFKGAGIYAIYYTGAFPAYAELSARNQEGMFSAPIYVGKAVPSGARKGGGAASGANSGRPLFNRLKEHAESVQGVTNLEIEDFHCRFLVVDDIWIPLGESLLIARYSPVWNSLVDGFGNHDPGKGRYNGMRPRWDVLHPGRAWATKCAERRESRDEIVLDVQGYFRQYVFSSGSGVA
jgi:Eco29kI restriction endonuclease